MLEKLGWTGLDWIAANGLCNFMLFIYIYLFIITPNGSITYKIYKSIYKKTHNTQYKKKLQTGITDGASKFV